MCFKHRRYLFRAANFVEIYAHVDRTFQFFVNPEETKVEDTLMSGLMAQKISNHTLLDDKGKALKSIEAYRFEAVNVDHRDIQKNHYQLYIVQYNPKYLVAIVPSVPASFTDDVVDEVPGYYIDGDNLRKSEKAALNKKENKERLHKYLLIEMPEPVTNDVFSPATSFGKVKLKVRKYKTPSLKVVGDEHHEFLKFNAIWHVSVDEETPRMLQNREEEENDGMEALEATLARVGMSTSP